MYHKFRYNGHNSHVVNNYQRPLKLCSKLIKLYSEPFTWVLDLSSDIESFSLAAVLARRNVIGINISHRQVLFDQLRTAGFESLPDEKEELGYPTCKKFGKTSKLKPMKLPPGKNVCGDVISVHAIKPNEPPKFITESKEGAEVMEAIQVIQSPKRAGFVRYGDDSDDFDTDQEKTPEDGQGGSPPRAADNSGFRHARPIVCHQFDESAPPDLLVLNLMAQAHQVFMLKLPFMHQVQRLKMRIQVTRMIQIWVWIPKLLTLRIVVAMMLMSTI